MNAVNPGSVQEYVNQLKINGMAKSTVIGIISVLSAAYEYVIEPLGYVRENPCSRVKMPKFERKPKERVVIPPNDFKRILECFPEETPFYIPLMIGYYTGTRISEAFCLTWDDIDFEKRTVSITKSVVKRNYGVDVRKALEKTGKKEERSAWYIGTPKTTSSIRTIKIGDTLYDALRREKTLQKKNRLRYGEYYTDHYLKPEKDEKENTIYRIIPIEACVDCVLQKVDLVCVHENVKYTSTDSFKYCSRVIHHELQIAFDYHSLRHPMRQY